MEDDNFEQNANEDNLIINESQYNQILTLPHAIIVYGDFEHCFWTKKVVHELGKMQIFPYKCYARSDLGVKHNINCWPIIRKLENGEIIYEMVGFPHRLEDFQKLLKHE